MEEIRLLSALARRAARRWPTLTLLACAAPTLMGCGAVRVGQTAEEAEAVPTPAASEPPDQDPDRPGETSPVITVDLDQPPDAGAR